MRVEHFLKPSDAFQLTPQFRLSEAVSTVVPNNRRILQDNGWPHVKA